MWRFWLAVVGFGILIGCNSIVSPSTDVVVSRASVPPQAWAWGERVDLGSNAKTVVITYPNGSQSFTLDQSHLFDIPAPPSDTEVLGTQGSVSLEMYNTPPTLFEQKSYTQRGILSVKYANGSEMTYTPYGSVVNGQISFLASIALSQYLPKLLHPGHKSFKSGKHFRVYDSCRR